MPNLPDSVVALLSASPMVLSLIVGLAAILLAAFAIYVVHHASSRGRDR